LINQSRRDVDDMIDVPFDAPILRASGPDHLVRTHAHHLTAPHPTGMPFWAASMARQLEIRCCRSVLQLGAVADLGDEGLDPVTAAAARMASFARTAE
jgi:hypothetical protein